MERNFIRMDNLWQFEAKASSEDFFSMEESLGDLIENLCWEDDVVTGLVLDEKRSELESRIGLPVAWRRLETVDWLEEDEKQLPPLIVGKLFVYTPHYLGEVPKDKIPLKLRSSYAFGSGHHPTTEGCLLAIQKLSSVRRALDIGCGSGILSLAIEELFQAEVIGSEIDGKSASMAKENVDGRVRIVHCDGVSDSEIRSLAPYDLIVSNIHSCPLCELAADIVPLIARGGTLILAGLLNDQQELVEQAYTSLGMRLQAVHRNDSTWPVLEFRAPA
jgi:ribosomal protein L11 methyltransferase